MFMAAVPGSTMDSFVALNGTNNGANLNPNNPAGPGPGQGGGVSPGKELLLQATLGTGADGTGLCPGGTAGTVPPPSGGGGGSTTPAVTLNSQTDGVNKKRNTTIAIFCASSVPCTGSLALVVSGSQAARTRTIGTASFSIPAHHTGKVKVKLTKKGFSLLKKHHRKLTVTLGVALSNGARYSRTIHLK